MHLKKLYLSNSYSSFLVGRILTRDLDVRSRQVALVTEELGILVRVSHHPLYVCTGVYHANLSNREKNSLFILRKHIFEYL